MADAPDLKSVGEISVRVRVPLPTLFLPKNKTMKITNIKAFPRPVGSSLEYFNYAQEGMTLLDYFAGKVLQNIPVTDIINDEEVAKECYAIAEAMLKERAKRIK